MTCLAAVLLVAVVQSAPRQLTKIVKGHETIMTIPIVTMDPTTHTNPFPPPISTSSGHSFNMNAGSESKSQFCKLAKNILSFCRTGHWSTDVLADPV